MSRDAWKTAIILITLYVLSAPIITDSTPSSEILVIISPGISWEEASYLANKLNISDYGLSKLHPLPPYDYDLFLYQLFTRNKQYYDVIPINEVFASMKGEVISWYNSVNQSQLLDLWGNVSLLNVLIVDPVKHPYAFNPAYDSLNRTIPPCIFTVEINGTLEWEILNTTLTFTLQDDLLRIFLNSYNVTLNINVTTKVSSEARVAVNDNSVLKNGTYYIKFYLVDINQTSATVFFPGTISSLGWQSPGLGEFTGTLPFWFLYREEIMSQLTPDDAVKWWINESVLAFEKTVTTALSRSSAKVHILYYPYYRFINNIDSRVNKSEAAKLISDSLSRIISQYLSGKPGSTVVLVNPFQVIGEPMDNFPGNRITRGFLNVTGRINDLYTFLSQEPYLNFTLINLNHETYLEIATPWVEGVGDGLIFFTPRSTVNLANGAGLDTSDIIEYIFMLSQGFNPSIGTLTNLISIKEKTIDEMNATITELQLRINELNATLTNLQSRLGECQSINAGLSTRILSIEDELKKAEELRNEAYTFITVGYIGLVIVSVGLALLSSRIISSRQKS